MRDGSPLSVVDKIDCRRTAVCLGPVSSAATSTTTPASCPRRVQTRPRQRTRLIEVAVATSRALEGFSDRTALEPEWVRRVDEFVWAARPRTPPILLRRTRGLLSRTTPRTRGRPRRPRSCAQSAGSPAFRRARRVVASSTAVPRVSDRTGLSTNASARGGASYATRARLPMGTETRSEKLRSNSRRPSRARSWLATGLILRRVAR